MATTEQAPIGDAAPAAAGEEEDLTLEQEVLRAFAFSPPFLVAWACGYLDDMILLSILSLMRASHVQAHQNHVILSCSALSLH